MLIFLQLRFEPPKRLLRQNYTVVGAAGTLDYESATIFIKAFKKRFGMTPKQWQKRSQFYV